MAHDSTHKIPQLERAAAILLAQAKIMKGELPEYDKREVRDHKFTLVLSEAELSRLEVIAEATGQSMASVMRKGMDKVIPSELEQAVVEHANLGGFFDEE